MQFKFAKAAVRAVPLAAAVAVGLGFAPAASAAPASTIFVPCDPAALASAISGASSGSTLFLAPFCVYTITAALPEINKTLHIVGAPSTIERSYADGTPDFTILTVGVDGDVVLSHVSFVNGAAIAGDADGGAIHNDGGFVVVNGGIFHGNSASDDGGAIYNDDGALHVNNAAFTGNTADTGGAIASNETATVFDSTFTSNSASEYGGAVYNASAPPPTSVDPASRRHSDGIGLTIGDSTFRFNHAQYGGGLTNDGLATLTSDLFNGNSASSVGGGIYNSSGDLTLTGCTLTRNRTSGYGGGLYNENSATLTGDVFSMNSATADGGGIYNDDSLTMSQTKLMSNRAGGQGGGLYNEDTATISSSQIQVNYATSGGGGIFNDDSISLTATSVTGNTPDNCEPLGTIPGCTG
jgi:predicted outer membrane repeat protein